MQNAECRINVNLPMANFQSKKISPCEIILNFAFFILNSAFKAIFALLVVFQIITHKSDSSEVLYLVVGHCNAVLVLKGHKKLNYVK